METEMKLSAETIEAIAKIFDDRQSALTTLAKSRKELTDWLTRSAFNNGNDLNGVKEKWMVVIEQIQWIDKQMLKLAGIKD